MPQIWDDYCEGDPEEIRLRRIGDIKAANKKKKEAQAAARKAKAAAKAKETAAPRRTGRKRTRTSKSTVSLSMIFSLAYMSHGLILHLQWTDPGPPPDETMPVPQDSGAIEEEEDVFQEIEPDSDEDNEGSTRPPNLHPDDPAHFMKLATVLQVFFAEEITDEQIADGDLKLREYCLDLLHVRYLCLCW